MSRSPRHLGLSAAVFLGAALFLAACATPPAEPDVRIPHPPNSPDGQISMISFQPAARCVLEINDHLEAQFRFDVPEAPCQIFARLDLPDNYSEFARHGFTSGSSASPALLSGHGILKQGFSVFYDPKRDERGLADTNFPPLFRATNATFTVYPGTMAGDEQDPLYFVRDDAGARKIYSVPVDVTWVCKKTPVLEARRAQELAEWKQVQALHPDAVLPEPPAKKSRAKKTNVEKPTAEP